MRILNGNNELAPVDAVRPHPRNPRQGDTGAIHESITANGFYGTIIAQKSTGYILAGNHRHQAAVQAGAAEIPVTWVDVDDDHALRILLADNRTNDLASYDDAALAEILKDIHEAHGTLAGTGYDGDALDDLLADLGEAPELGAPPEAQVDRADELREKWGTELGQLWTIGKHRLLCGDSTSKDDVTSLMNGKLADSVLTDPPYGQNQPGVTHDSPDELQGIITGMTENLPLDNGVMIAFQSPRTFPMLLDAGRNAGLKFERMLWLYKAAQMTFPWRGWILKSESILVFTRGEGQWQEVNPYAHDCYYLPEVSGELPEDSGWHGSVKPLTVVADLLKRITPRDGLVYEPFAGSGTTIVAAEQAGRTCYGMEIDPAYVAVALERLSAMGLTPELAK